MEQQKNVAYLRPVIAWVANGRIHSLRSDGSKRGKKMLMAIPIIRGILSISPIVPVWVLA
ncbi:hypothetical protein [Escherichia coli]|uniref:hypothetical protein n=1 Tax=Escherichia coli TaxID=562 RepID=UPI0010057FCB|nr:Uncharacterised protein [Escherichia coli]